MNVMATMTVETIVMKTIVAVGSLENSKKKFDWIRKTSLSTFLNA